MSFLDWVQISKRNKRFEILKIIIEIQENIVIKPKIYNLVFLLNYLCTISNRYATLFIFFYIVTICTAIHLHMRTIAHCMRETHLSSAFC